MNKKPEEDIEKAIKKKFPDYRPIEKIEDAKDGDVVAIEAKILSDKIKLSPPIRFLLTSGKSENPSFSGSILNIPFEIKDGLLYKNTKGAKSLNTHSDEYNLIIAGFNIIGLPFDFTSNADIILTVEDKVKKSFEISFTDKAKRRGYDIPMTDINPDEKETIKQLFDEMSTRLITNRIEGLDDIIKYFGYANYHLFHGDLNLTFINSWMFIEPYINHLWTVSIKETFTGLNYNPIKEERNWSLQQKIDELFILGKINRNTRDFLQKMRNKRNKVFHVDDNPVKRRVEVADSLECFKLSRILFYKMIGYPEGKIVVCPSANDVRERMGVAIFGETFKHNAMRIM